MESEIRKMLDKAEKLVNECISCGNPDCYECEEANQLLDKIKDHISSLKDKKTARRLSVFLEDLENKLQSIE